jgi:hypothetical protein
MGGGTGPITAKRKAKKAIFEKTEKITSKPTTLNKRGY